MRSLYLAAILLSSTVLADTTGNLITNGTFDNGTTGWTLSGDAQRINDCCPGGYDLEFGDSGSIEQTFGLTSNNISQPMLDNGITLNSSVEVQNGECGVAQCWGGSGPADTFTIRLQIRDSDSNVLATTTQERTNVTGINGKDFEDSVSFTGTGSNQGNIFISGSDGNSPNTLGGPNVDNIAVTMTYDPVVLSATETAIIATAFEEIEEVLTTVSPEELFIYEEFIVEEFIPFEEPEILIEMIEEITFEEIAIEEINTGIVEIFTVAIEEEIVPMEVTYEEPETIEAFTTEVESFEETSEITETIEPTGEIPGGNSNEQNKTIKGNTNAKEEITVASGEQEESRGTERLSEREVNSTQSEESNSDATANSESRAESRNETSSQTNPDSGSGTESDTEVSQVANQSVQVADIEKQVSQTIKELDQQLVATSNIVASLMVTTNLDSYTNMNQDILKQPIIDGGNIDEYYSRNYSDGRNIYAETQISYNDPVFLYQRKVEEAVDEVIRAEEHLRRVRGY
tara:strand:- start:3581 stop:5128 length:1548 start_codon:yes stop_codon:yes gene_type:complete